MGVGIVVFLLDGELLQVGIVLFELVNEGLVDQLSPFHGLSLALMVLPADEGREFQAELHFAWLPELRVIKGAHGQEKVREDCFSSALEVATLASQLQDRQDVHHRFHLNLGILDHNGGNLKLGGMHDIADGPDGREPIHFGTYAPTPLVLGHKVSPVQFLHRILGVGAADEGSVRLQALQVALDIGIKVAVVSFQASNDEVILLTLLDELAATELHVGERRRNKRMRSERMLLGQVVLHVGQHVLRVVAMDANVVEVAVDGAEHLHD